MALLIALMAMSMMASPSAEAQNYKRHQRVDLPPFPAPSNNFGCYSWAVPTTGSPGPGWGYFGTGSCPLYQIRLAGYSCATDAFQGSSSEFGGLGLAACCECDPQGAGSGCDAAVKQISDDAIVPAQYSCEPSYPATGGPPGCSGTRPPPGAAPVDPGCGDDEQHCSADDSDAFPVRFSSGRVQSNLLTLFEEPAPDDIFFGYRIIYNSAVSRSQASTSLVGGVQDAEPTIHHSDEATHFIGKGWLDNYSDRLLIDVFNLPSNKITWVRQNGTVTFTNSAGSWTSYGGKYLLLDRGANPPDGLGRWVVRTTDDTEPRKIWSFEEYTFRPYSGTATRKMGRLRRHAVLTSNLTDLNGRYGLTVSWTSSGTISTVVDSLGRSLSFAYRTEIYQTRPSSRSVQTVSYQASPGGGYRPVVDVQMDSKNRILDRVAPVGASTYYRFLYTGLDPSTGCTHCGSLLTDVIVPKGSVFSTPQIQTGITANELAVEHDDYGVFNGTAVGVHSRGVGREYGYEYTTSGTTQFDMKQDGGACGTGGACSSGFQCLASAGRCYVATGKTHDTTTILGTGSAPVGTPPGAVNGSSESFTRAYTATGAPHDSKDAAAVRTTYTYDTSGRITCLVRNDDDSEAAPCGGPPTAQVVGVSYSSSAVTKTTASVLSGSVVETQNLDPTTRLPTSSVTVGMTRDIAGVAHPETHTTTRTYDAYGRVLDVNGPLTDSTYLDKTSTAYYTTFNASFPDNYGRVSQVTQYVGTSSASTALTTTYSEYDLFGVAHRLTYPNGDNLVLTPSTDRLTWTVAHTGGALSSTTTVKLNTDGTVRSVTDADLICTTYEYSDATGFLGVVTKMRRAASTDACGTVPVNVSSGEVELRTYMNGDPDRLQSITRQLNGVVAYTYSGFTYDRDRRLTTASTLDSATPFALSYTDVIQTGTSAPGAPSAGSWQTDTTVDAFARTTLFLRYLGGGNKQTFTLGYSSTLSARPTTLTRGLNGAAASTTTFIYDDFSQLVETTVPESGAPGSPAATRYEYDVGGRMVKKRIGTGTASVRPDAYAYDSLGRTLAVDRDTEHPIDCAQLGNAGVGIQDDEFKYDSCVAPDVPTGFACTNALGRLTLAREVLQCGNFQTVKRGRWYDYDSLGQLSRVAYATVTGSTIGTPAIMDYTYWPSGKLRQYRSPLNSAYGTSYTYSTTSGAVATVGTSAPTPLPILTSTSFLPFGPLSNAVTPVTQASGTTIRTLMYGASYRTDYLLSNQTWGLEWTSGPIGFGISLMNQTFGRTAASAISTRTDLADVAASRYYGYDALLRLTCEARGVGTTNPTSADCVETSPRLAALHAFNDGASASAPVDTRLSSFMRTENASYVSPAKEYPSYSAGSSRNQGVTRTGSSLVLGYDGLGRRSFEYDSFDPSRSRRDYSYLPNGQLGTVSGFTPANTAYAITMRYDERGRPVTMSTLDYATNIFGLPRDSYELFWDDADRLIAVKITMPACRGAGTWGCTHGGYNSATWHYHYLGNQLVAATRTIGISTKRFWAVSDERGLIYRLIDQNGGTAWQARWDANGHRTIVGSQIEMFVPFGLPGQVILDTMEIAYDDQGVVHQNIGTEAFASGTSGTWIRPPIALNQWRSYDPIAGAFIQPDPADQRGRLNPEEYLLARGNPLYFVDPDGADSTPNESKEWFPSSFSVTWDESCSERKEVYSRALQNAAMDIRKCTSGDCGNATIKRQLLFALSVGTYYCVSSDRSLSLTTYEGGLRTERNFHFDGNGQVQGSQHF